MGYDGRMTSTQKGHGSGQSNPEGCGTSAGDNILGEHPPIASRPGRALISENQNTHPSRFSQSRPVTLGHGQSRPVTQFSEKKDCLFFRIASLLLTPLLSKSVFHLWLKQTQKSMESNRNRTATHQKILLASKAVPFWHKTNPFPPHFLLVNWAVFVDYPAPFYVYRYLYCDCNAV